MSVIDALLQYQEIDKKLYEMNIEILKSKPGQDRIAVKKKEKQILEDLVKIDKQCADTVKEYNELDKKLSKLTQELEEYDGIEEDINSKEQSEYCLNKINELIQKIEGVTKQIADTNRKMDKSLQIADKIRENYNKNKADIVQADNNLLEYRKPYLDKFNEFTGKQAELEKIIGDELIDKYKNLKKRYPNTNVFVELRGDDKNGWMCTGCFLESTAADVRMKETGKEIVECQSCGRLVYKKK